MKHTIRFLAVALCLLFACDAGARTLYVDARRPNNNGNGRSLRKAKRTIQAAVNIANNGDTIIVYPGSYGSYLFSPSLQTNNKKIKIKAKSGASKTEVEGSLFLGKSGSGKGKNTKFLGFNLGCLGYMRSFGYNITHAYGGTITSCVCRDGSHTGENASYNRCKFFGNDKFSESKFTNCLFEDALSLKYSTLVNCTISPYGNSPEVELAFVKAYNTIFYNVPASQFKKSQYNKLKNCYKGENPGFVSTPTRVWVEDSYYDEGGYWGISGGGNYRLKKGSPCINKGKLTAAQKKLVGTKDLAGKKRVRGRSVDIGCYEY